MKRITAVTKPESIGTALDGRPGHVRVLITLEAGGPARTKGKTVHLHLTPEDVRKIIRAAAYDDATRDTLQREIDAQTPQKPRRQ